MTYPIRAHGQLLNKWMHESTKARLTWHITCFPTPAETMASCRSPRVRECFRTAFCKVWKDWRHAVDPAVGSAVDLAAESLTRLTSIWVRPSFCAIVGMTWGSSLLANRPTSCSEGDLDSRYSLSPDKSIYTFYVIYTATMDHELQH